MTYKAATDKQAFYPYDYSGSYGIKSQDFTGRYMQHTASFFAKKFFIKKGYIAPVGRYLILGCYYQYVTNRVAILNQSVNSFGDYTYNVEGKKGTAHFAGLTIGMGRNFVVAKRMIIDIGFTLSASPYIIIESGSPYGITNGTKVTAAVYRDLTLRNLFQLNLGLGGLAF